MINNNPLKISRFTRYGVFLTGRKAIQPPPSISDVTCRHPAIAVGLKSGANRGFGAGENDWLGAEAYVDPLR